VCSGRSSAGVGRASADLRVLMVSVVIEDGVNELAVWHGRLDRIEEADELLMPVTLHAAADDRAVEHIKRGEQVVPWRM
jgi:hypothetical protein